MYRLAACALFAATAAFAAPAPAPRAKCDSSRLPTRQALLERLAVLGTSEHRWFYVRKEGVHVFQCTVKPTADNPLDGDRIAYGFYGEGADEIAALQDAIARIEKTFAEQAARRR